jgi:hypothetical protein
MQDQNHRWIRASEKIGSQAKAPAPPDRKSLCVNVGQALSPANCALMPIFSRLLWESVPLFFNHEHQRLPPMRYERQ